MTRFWRESVLRARLTQRPWKGWGQAPALDFQRWGKATVACGQPGLSPVGWCESCPPSQGWGRSTCPVNEGLWQTQERTGAAGPWFCRPSPGASVKWATGGPLCHVRVAGHTTARAALGSQESGQGGPGPGEAPQPQLLRVGMQRSHLQTRASGQPCPHPTPRRSAVGGSTPPPACEDY